MHAERTRQAQPTRHTVGPVLCRISGLPSGTLEHLGDPDLLSLFDTRRELEQALERCRAQITDRLYDLVGSSPPELRRFYLAVRRDCHNGRSLDPHRSDPRWERLCEHLGEELGRLADLETRWAACSEDLAQRHGKSREQEIQALLDLAQEPGFRRGLTLSSPVLAGRLGANDGTPDSGRRGEKMAASLARYVSRAAVKLSPFSSLTRLALGTVRPETEAAGGSSAIAWTAPDWSERSMLRLHRHLIDQCVELLRGYPPFRDRTQVCLNDTLCHVGGNRYRSLRPDFWIHEAASGFRYLREAWVTLNLEGAWIEWLREALAGGAKSFQQVVEEALRESPGSPEPEWVAGMLDTLRQRSVLCYLTPWPVTEPWPERALLAELDSRLEPTGSPPSAVIEPLRRLVELEQTYFQSREPEVVLAELNRRFREVWRAAADLGGIEGEIEPKTVNQGFFYEDVLLVPADLASDLAGATGNGSTGITSDRPLPGALLSVSSDRIETLLEDTKPVVALSHLFNPSLDFRVAVADFASRHWPGRQEIGVIELFEEMRPLLRELQRFRSADREDEDPCRTFDPQQTPRAGLLRSCRQRLWQDYQQAVEPGEEEDRLDSGALQEAVSRIPDAFQPPVGACLMAQIADLDSGRWVLNRLFEGTGRYGSRYLPILPEEARRAYQRFLTDQRTDSPALLDLLWVQGDNLGLHDLYAPAVLERPGTASGASEDARVRLGELRLRWRGGEAQEEARNDLPILTDGSGRQLLPVHLGGASLKFLPPTLRFLAQLGPGEMSSVLPPGDFREQGDLRVRSRLVLGHVVLRRRSWSLRPADLRDRLEGLSESEAFAEIHRWRTRRALPRRAFVIEKVTHSHYDDVYKPQYLDFLSPLFVTLFRSALQTRAERLTLMEPLPDLDQMVSDPGATRWAVELQVDRFALRREPWYAPLAPRVSAEDSCPPHREAGVIWDAGP